MTAWVLLRGWTREAAHWGAFPAQLAEAIPGIQVLTPDLPGTGVLFREHSPWRIAGYVSRLREVLLEGGHGPPYDLVGISMGGMVAIEWAHRHPEEIGKAAVVNTSAPPFAAPFQRLRPSSYSALAEISRASDPETREARILCITSRKHCGDAALARDWAAIARARPVSAANSARQFAAAMQFHAPRAPPPVSWLVVCSAGDDLVDTACSRQLATAWNVPFVEHPWGGHELMVDDGPWVAQQVAAAFAP